MEVFLAKEVVKIIPTNEVFSGPSTDHQFLIEIIDFGHGSGHDNGNDDFFSLQTSEIQVNPAFQVISNTQVAFSSGCSESNEHTEQFAKGVEMMLKRKVENLAWNKIHVELLISNNPLGVSNYLTVYTKPTDGNQVDVFAQLKELDAKFSVQISLCHVPTEYSVVPSDSLISFECAVGHRVPVQTIPEVKMWSELNVGFIYFILSVQATLNDKAVNLVYCNLGGNGNLLHDSDFTDLEMRSKDGDVVQCHRVIVAAKSEVIRAKLKDIIKQGEEMKLEIETSKNCLKALLEYIYTGAIGRSLRDCNASLELLLVARDFEVTGLERTMREIIMAKRTSDFKYFSVEGALDLFLYTRSEGGLMALRDKAVRVLKNYLRINSDKILASEKYQDLFQKQPRLAMELATLYIKLS